MRYKLKRGVAIEYALIVMLIVFAFTAIILSTTVLSVDKAGEYEDYVVQKANLDEIGSLVRLYYCNNADNAAAITEAAGDEYTVETPDKSTVSADGDILTATVLETDSDEVLLTLQFTYSTSNSGSFTLSAYVYGEI